MHIQLRTRIKHPHTPKSNTVYALLMLSSLLADLKELKNSKPVVEAPKNRNRMERVMQFEEANGISLSKNANSKKYHRRGGLFDDIVFCFPLLDPPNDPSPERLAQLAKGIYSQGGRLLDYTSNLTNRSVKYVLIDERTDVGLIREAMRGRVLYVAILNYRWVEDCLRKLAKVEIVPYNLERNYTATEESRAEAKRKLEEDIALFNKRKAVDEDGVQQSVKNENKDENQSDSDTVVMEEPQNLQQKPQQQPKKEDLDDGKDKEVNIQQAIINPADNDGSMQEEVDLPPKVQESSEEQQFHSVNHSKAFEWPQPSNDGNESDATEKMGSEDQCPNNPSPIATSFKKNRTQIQKISELPQVCRRKTKLAIGSHQFATNNLICQKLKQMQQIYQNTGDRRQYAYLRAIAAIRNYGKEIKKADQLRNIEGLGRKTIAKIREYLKTGSIAKVQHRLNAKGSVPHKELLRVHGIGLSKAEELAHKGIRTVEDLRKNEQLLTVTQRMGLKYVEEFQERIPREKAARMLELVKQTLFYIARSDSHHEIQAAGSFRRGKATCGDLDILVTRKDGGVEKGLLTQLVGELQRRGFITDHFTKPRPFDGKRAVHYMGVCQLDGGLHHRIDLKLYPVEQYAFALLYFTGSDLFNREMRMNAMEQGLILGDHEVRRRERNVGKPWPITKIPTCYTEKDIFDLLGMEFRHPSQREL